MNTETKIRTVAAVLTYIVLWVKSMWGLDLSELFTPEVITSIATLVVVGGVWFASHFYNNDYTAEAAEGTNRARFLKFLRKTKAFGLELYGENFFDATADNTAMMREKENGASADKTNEETEEGEEEDEQHYL